MRFALTPRDVFSGAAAALALMGAAAAPLAGAAYEALLKRMEERAEHYGRLSRSIWEFAEMGYQETRSSALLQQELRAAAFRIRANIGAMPTAFTAEWGAGQPVIGILGEFDALPGLSQDAVPLRRPLQEGAAGHGCGHNLFGVASAFAAVSIKDYMAANGLSGTLRYYGTPAEEGGAGKVYMIRAGAFENVSAVLAWHPSSENRASVATNNAVVSARFHFRGRPAHAAMAPEAGRSALDAVMLFTHGVDLLREHIPPSARVHYVISRGGAAPNIVPESAEVYLYARYPDVTVLDGVWARIDKCAQGAALATETTHAVHVDSAAYNMLPNDTLARLFDESLRQTGGVRYTGEERAFAEAISATLPPASRRQIGEQERVLPINLETSMASSDVADVSWVVPTGEFTAATWVPGVPAHTWQSTACSGMSIGRKGMLVAAKTLALTAIRIYETPGLADAARRDFDKRRGTVRYNSRIPADAKPPLDYRRR